MKKKLTAAILAIFIMLTGSLTWATDNTQTGTETEETTDQVEQPTEEEVVSDFELTADNQEGSRVVNLAWEKVDDTTTLLDVAKVGDYVSYPITYNEVYSSLNNLGARPASSMQWRVLSIDGTTIKLISTAPVATVNMSTGQNYSGIADNPYGYGASDGDNGGYGYYHKIQAIAKCFAKPGYAVSARSVDIPDLRRSAALTDLKEHLGDTETDDISIELRDAGYTEIHDTEKHGGSLFSSGKRIYNRKVASITNSNSLYVGGKFFLPNYYNGNNGLNSVYYVNGTNVYLQRLYPYGEAITTGVKVVVTLDTDLYRISGNGSSTTPWEISTTPTHAPYTVYQKQEGGQWVAKGEPSRVPSKQLTSADGLEDYGAPYKPNAVIDTIKGDDWNIKLTVYAGDTGTEYYHQVKANSDRIHASNETCVTIMTGVKGYSYVIDQEPDTIPDDEIEFEEGESIKITRLKVNTNPRYIIHIKAIDYAGNTSETLHLELRATFREIPLHQIYQAAGNYNEYGIAGTPGDNSITVEWGAMDEGPDGPEIEYHIPDICLVVDISGSMYRYSVKSS